MEQQTLLQLATKAREMSYSPYSNFAVGASLQTTSGKQYSGCNFENASYRLTQCAEANAIGQMITGGDHEITAMALIADADVPVTPCGACRQTIREFAQADTIIHMYNLQGDHKQMTVADLLPESFGPDFLEK